MLIELELDKHPFSITLQCNSDFIGIRFLKEKNNDKKGRSRRYFSDTVAIPSVTLPSVVSHEKIYLILDRDELQPGDTFQVCRWSGIEFIGK